MLTENVFGLENTVEAFQESFLRHARYLIGKEWKDLSPYDRFLVVSMSVRDRLLDRRGGLDRHGTRRQAALRR